MDLQSIPFNRSGTLALVDYSLSVSPIVTYTYVDQTYPLQCTAHYVSQLDTDSLGNMLLAYCQASIRLVQRTPLQWL